jgi:hypothetical protein
VNRLGYKIGASVQQGEKGKEDAEKQAPKTARSDHDVHFVWSLPDRLVDIYGGW